MGLFGSNKYGDGRDAPQSPGKPPIPFANDETRRQDAERKRIDDNTQKAMDNWKNKNK